MADLENQGRPPVIAVLTGTQVKAEPVSSQDRWLALLRLAGGRPRWLCEGPRAAGGRYSYALRGNASQVLGGISGIAAGLCWVVKSTVILVSGWQPALIFELAPLLMSVAVQVLVYQLPVGRLRAVACAERSLFGSYDENYVVS